MNGLLVLALKTSDINVAYILKALLHLSFLKIAEYE
jgi:hypothetical protein